MVQNKMSKNNDRNELNEEEIKELEKGPSKKEGLSPYKQGFLSKIPYGVKACFLKWWFFGAIYFFIGFGLSTVLNDAALIYIVIIIANGFVTDFVCDNILILMDSDQGESNTWMMFHSRKLVSTFINLGYSIVLISLGSLAIRGLRDYIFVHIDFLKDFGGEPITFGLVILMVDLFFILIKNLIVNYVKKQKELKK